MTQSTLTPQRILITVAVVFLVGYGIFNSRFMLKGPELAIAGLDSSGEIIRTDVKDFSLKGTVLHSSYITINNRPITVDELGNFNEKLLLSNGVSVIDIYARDKFGKEVRKKVGVVYTGDSPTFAGAYSELALRSKTATSTEDVVPVSKPATEVEVVVEDNTAVMMSIVEDVVATTTDSGGVEE
jgi:hypothetical protein